MVNSVLRSSEFWIAVAVGIGQILSILNVVDAQSFENVLMPSLVYIIGRLTSKLAKGGIK